MFKLTPNPTFTTDVELHVAGLKEPGIINITFKYLTPAQLVAWQKADGKKSHAEALKEVIFSWSGVEDLEGRSVDYSFDNLKKLLATYHAAGQEITQAYIRELLGARLKN
jgi:hypothetical protein